MNNLLYEDIPEGTRPAKDGMARGKGSGEKPQFDELYQKIIRAAGKREPDEKLRHLVEESQVGVFIIRGDRFLHVNQRFAEMFGYTPDELISTIHVCDLVSSEDRDTMNACLQAQISDGQRSRSHTFRGLRKNGERIHVEITATRSVFHGQTIVVGTMIDINGYLMAERFHTQANRRITVLNTLTRHDIANRLTVLRGRLKNIRRQYNDPTLLLQLKNVDDAGRDIYKILETARQYQEIGLCAPQWQNLQEIIAKEQDQQGITTLHVTLMITGLEVYADPLLPRVISNLLDNTVRHGGHASEIRISFERSAGGITVSWEDNGIGIPADLKGQIFEQEYPSSTNLGLFLCREILAGTGITLYETGTFGEGARFEMNIPDHAWKIAGTALGIAENRMPELSRTRI